MKKKPDCLRKILKGRMHIKVECFSSKKLKSWIKQLHSIYNWLKKLIWIIEYNLYAKQRVFLFLFADLHFNFSIPFQSGICLVHLIFHFNFYFQQQTSGGKVSIYQIYGNSFLQLTESDWFGWNGERYTSYCENHNFCSKTNEAGVWSQKTHWINMEFCEILRRKVKCMLELSSQL